MVDELASAAESAGQEAVPTVDRLFGALAVKLAPRRKCGPSGAEIPSGVQDHLDEGDVPGLEGSQQVRDSTATSR